VAYHNILSKCDQALVAYIIAGNAGTSDDVFPAKRSLSKTVPCTVCESRRGEPQAGAEYSGNYTIQALVKVRCSGLADTASDNESGQPRLDSDARVAATFDLFQTADPDSGIGLAAAIQLAAADPDFGVINARVTGVEAGFEREGSGWVDVLHLELVCCPMAL
jgi:hypothetical protein